MMEYLPHISWDVLRSLNSLFELNLYVVFTNFVATDDIAHLFHGLRGNVVENNTTQWNGLRTGICRIADEMDAGEVLLRLSVSKTGTGNMDEQRDSSMSRDVTLRTVVQTPSAFVDKNESNLYALAERSVACEAVVGQSRLLNAIEELARSYLPDRYHVRMNEMLQQNCTMARELCSFMYTTIAARLANVPDLFDAVSAVSWNMTYICDQHNEYIEQLIRKCGETWERLQLLANEAIPFDACDDIWAALVQTIMDTLLQALSAVHKPTLQGRALMLLDLHALQNGLDMINHVSSRTVPRGHEYVGNYIKAFYYDENELLEWIQDNKVSCISYFYVPMELTRWHESQALYSKTQFANLLQNGVGLTMEMKEFRELVLKLDTIVA